MWAVLNMDQTQHMGKGCSGKPTYRSDASAPLKTQLSKKKHKEVEEEREFFK